MKNPLCAAVCAALTLAPLAKADLVAFYCFDNAGDTFEDTSGNGNHITGTAGTDPIWGATAGFNGTGAYDFSTDRLVVPIDVNSGALPQMTWGAWVRTDDLASGLRKFIGHDNGAWDRTLGLDNRTAAGGGSQPGGTFRYSAFTGTNNNGPVQITPNSDAAPTSTTDWSFVAASYDQATTTMTFYVDLDASTSEPLSATTTAAVFGLGETTFAIGGISPANANEAWDGAIDNVFLYDEVLDLAKLTAIRDDGKDEILGLNITDPEIVVGPPFLFGDLTSLGAGPGPIPQSVTISNTGATLDLNLTSLTITGPDASRYAITPPLPTVVGPGADVAVEVTFTPPPAGGSFVAALEIAHDDPNDPTVSIPLDATVTSDPEIAVSANDPLFGTLGFANIPPTVVRTVTIQNSGVVNTLNVSAPVIAGTDMASYSVDPSPIAIPPGGSADLDVILTTGGVAGSFVAELQLSSDDPDSAGFTIPLDAVIELVDLVAFYSFDNEADPLADSSGNANTLTIAGGTDPVWDECNGFNGTGAYDFSGDRLIAPIDINAGVRPRMTWGAWVRTDTVTSGLHKVMGHDNGGWDRTIGLDNRNPNGDFRYTSFTGDNPVNASGPVEGTPGPANTEDWTFIAASYDQVALTVTMYVDLDASTTADPLVAITEPAGFGGGFPTFAIGGIRPDNANEPWDGAIDNVFLYDGALSASDVTAIRDKAVNQILYPGADPSISVSPLKLFGDLTLLGAGTGPQVQSVTITNFGATQDLNLGALSITGPDMALYSASTPPATVAPGASVTVDVTLTPPAAGGSFQADLIIPSDDANTPSVTVTLDAIVAPDPNIAVAPSALFGDLTGLGAGPGPVAEKVTISNTGATLPLNLSSLTITGPDMALYQITPPAPTMVGPGADVMVEITFTPPPEGGAFAASLEIASDDADEALVIVPLDATVTTDPEIEVLADDPLFGTLIYNALPDTIVRTITVRNNGVANTLTIDPLVPTGVDAASYSVSGPSSLAPGEEGEIVVTLSPGGMDGPYVAELQITSNDPDSPGVTILLDADLVVVAPASLLGFYCFDNESDPFEDLSGNGNDITGVAGPGGPAYGVAAGFEGGAYTFGGDGDRLLVPIDVQASALPDMTWGAWVRPDDINPGLRKVLGHDNGAWDRSIGLDDRLAAEPFRYTSFTGIGVPAVGAPAPVNTTDWTFLAASYNGTAGNLVLYVDLDASTTGDPLVQVTTPANWAGNPGFPTFSIGSIRPDVDSEGWSGSIDNVFVYDGVLTTAKLEEIRAGKAGIIVPAAPFLYDVALNAAQDTGTLFFRDLQVGQTYHVVGSDDGETFFPVPDSEFVATTAEQTIDLSIDVNANPVVIVKGEEGPLPAE